VDFLFPNIPAKFISSLSSSNANGGANRSSDLKGFPRFQKKSSVLVVLSKTARKQLEDAGTKDRKRQPEWTAI